MVHHDNRLIKKSFIGYKKWVIKKSKLNRIASHIINKADDGLIQTYFKVWQIC